MILQPNVDIKIANFHKNIRCQWKLHDEMFKSLVVHENKNAVNLSNNLLVSL